MYLFSCLVTVNKYDPWVGEGPYGVGMADGPLSRPTRRCPGHWPNKRGFCPIDGDAIPRLGDCQLAEHFRGAEPLGANIKEAFAHSTGT